MLLHVHSVLKWGWPRLLALATNIIEFTVSLWQSNAIFNPLYYLRNYLKNWVFFFFGNEIICFLVVVVVQGAKLIISQLLLWNPLPMFY